MKTTAHNGDILHFLEILTLVEFLNGIKIPGWDGGRTFDFFFLYDFRVALSFQPLFVSLIELHGD